MKFTKVIALAVIVASSGVSMSQAQSLRSAGEPAEFPPSSYKGTQYVDSLGCVYVRAGISGNVSWIPRVSRSRDQICGQTPSNVGRASAPQTVAEEPVQITLDAPSNVEAAPVQTAIPEPKRVVRQPVAVQPQRVQAARPAAVAVPVEVAKAAPAAAPAATKTVKVRRQTVTRFDGRSDTAETSAESINGATRVVPKHVWINRQNTQNLPIPEGYRSVWTDDRLNPHRAEQSLEGQALVKLVWTRTVPRRLVDTTSGRDLTATVPLVYPFLDVATQTRDLGKVSIVQRDGKVQKRIQRNRAATVRRPVVSSRSAPAAQKTPSPKAVKPQSIRVGTFDQQQAAQKIAKRVQRMGYPVRIGKFTRDGKTYRMVLAGPFGADANRALTNLRSAGYSNATFR